MISAVLIVKNEAENLPACLEALKKVVSEVIVVDHESSDDTVVVAKKNGALVFEKKWEGYAAGKNFGHAKTSNNWILSIDADEIISAELIDSISELNLEDPNVVFAIDRANYFGEVWVKHCGWYPDWKIRIFHKEMATWEGDFVHERLRFSEKVIPVRLKGKLRHNSYSSDIDHLHRIKKYATLAAEKMIAENKNPSWLIEKLSPSFRFLRTYIFKKGFLDGALGWKISKRNAALIRMKFKIFHQLKNQAK